MSQLTLNGVWGGGGGGRLEVNGSTVDAWFQAKLLQPTLLFKKLLTMDHICILVIGLKSACN